MCHPCVLTRASLTSPPPPCAGCADSLDLGETSYSMVLADDLDGNGKLDLLVRGLSVGVWLSAVVWWCARARVCVCVVIGWRGAACHGTSAPCIAACR